MSGIDCDGGEVEGLLSSMRTGSRAGLGARQSNTSRRGDGSGELGVAAMCHPLATTHSPPGSVVQSDGASPGQQSAAASVQHGAAANALRGPRTSSSRRQNRIQFTC